MKSIFLNDSDEEAVVEFVKQHEELYDKTNDSFKVKQKKERLWEQLDMASSLRRCHDKQLRRVQNDRPG